MENQTFTFNIQELNTMLEALNGYPKAYPGLAFLEYDARVGQLTKKIGTLIAYEQKSIQRRLSGEQQQQEQKVTPEQAAEKQKNAEIVSAVKKIASEKKEQQN